MPCTPRQKPQSQWDKLNVVAKHPCVQTTLDEINRLIAKLYMKTIHMPAKKTTHQLGP